jgi:hypothetical protein
MNIKITFIFKVDCFNEAFSLGIIWLSQMTLLHTEKYNIVLVNRLFIDRIHDPICRIGFKTLTLS